MLVRFRSYEEKDIPLKVKWVNDPNINKYLHYDLPISNYDEFNWYERVLKDEKRDDNVIELVEEGSVKTVGLIGLINIDLKNKKAEFYITIGENDFHSKGVAYKASEKFILKMFEKYELIKIYLYTEEDNKKAQNLFEKLSFEKEGLLLNDLLYDNKQINRFVYGLQKHDFMS